MPITVDTTKHVEASIAATMDNAWRPMFNAGRYAFDKGDNEKAAALFDQSIGIHASSWNHWWAAQVHAKLKHNVKAREHAQKAMELGKGDAVFKRAFEKNVQKALDTWPKS